MTRISAEEALDSPRRRNVFAAIQASPGVSFRELSRRSGVAPGTLRHHLNVLCQTGFVVEQPHGATIRFFDGEARGKEWIEVVVRREPSLAALHDWLKLNPRASQRQVLEAMRAHGWARSTTQHRLSRLVEAGLAVQVLQGRYKLHSAAETSPPSSPTATIPEAALASI
ncbi:MAG: winged helix-turn-helix transcriptional regulator [Thermoplasmatota archaeon]